MTVPRIDRIRAGARRAWRAGVAGVAAAAMLLTSGAVAWGASTDSADSATPVAVSTSAWRAGSVQQSAPDPGTPSEPSAAAEPQTGTVTVSAEQGTTLDGRTVEFRLIGALNDKGGMNSASEQAAEGAREAGGTGSDPVSSLFALMVRRQAYTDVAAPKLLAAVASRPADATLSGAGSIDLPAGWYVASVNGSNAPPQLVVSGQTRHDGVEQAMLSGQATLEGDPAPAAAAIDQQAASTLSAARASAVDTIDFKNTFHWGQYGTGDYVWHGATGDFQAFCMDPDVKSPDAGTHVNASVLDDDRLRTIVYYGYNGPASIFTETQGTYGVHVNATQGDQVWATHLALAVTWQNLSPDHKFKYANGPANMMIGVNELLGLRDSHPLSRAINLTVWRLDPANGRQNLLGWTFTPSRIEVKTYLDNRAAVKGDLTQGLRDRIVVTVRDGGWAAGEQLLVCTDLYHDATPDGLRPDGSAEAAVTDGEQKRSKCVVANPSSDVPRDGSFEVWSDWFSPSDFDWAEWQPGRIWADTYVDTHHNDSGAPDLGGSNPQYAHQFNFANQKFYGKDDPDEGLTLMTLTGSTSAATADGQSVDALRYGSLAEIVDNVSLQATPRFASGTNWGGYSGNRQLTARVTMNYRAVGASDVKRVEKTQCVWSDTGDPCDGSRAKFSFADLGMQNGLEDGKYWFDQEIDAQDDLVKPLILDGENDPAESWTIETPEVKPAMFSTTAQATFPDEGGSAPVHDVIHGTADFKATVNGTATLHWASSKDATHPEKSFTTSGFGIATSGDTQSPDVSPSDFGWTKWPAGRYWWDSDIPVQRFVTTAVFLPGIQDDSEQWFAAPGETMRLSVSSQASNGLADKWDNSDVTADTVLQPRAGKGSEADGSDGDTGFVGTNLIVEGSSDPIVDRVRLTAEAVGGDHHDWDADGDGTFDSGVTVTVTTTLRTPSGVISKDDTFDSYWRSGTACGADSATGCREYSFSPADFGLATWPASDMWLTSRVSSVNGADMNGMTCPAGQTEFLGVPGSHRLCVESIGTESSPNAASEQIHVAAKFAPSIESSIAEGSRDDGKAPKDDVTVSIPQSVAGLKVVARGKLYWSAEPGKQGAVPADAREVADLSPLEFAPESFSGGRATATYDPASDPAVSGADLGTGYYTYVWRIEKRDLLGQNVTVSWQFHGQEWQQRLAYPSDMLLADMPDEVSDGWQPDSEQARMDSGWTLSVVKLAHSGNADGKWYEDRPAIGAVLHLQEATDSTAATLLPGSSDETVTLDGSGAATFPRQTIQAGQTRYYRLWESSVSKPLNVPRDGAWWIVTVVNEAGTTGASTVTVTGSSDETGWLVKGEAEGTDPGTVSPGSGIANHPTDWRQTIGDTVDANVTPPITGARGDTGLILAMTAAGLIALVLLASAAAIRLTRRTGAHRA